MEKGIIKNHISSSEFEKIKRRMIGEGRDAKVYVAPNSMLYKVYKKDISRFYNAQYDEYGVRIDKVKPTKTDISYIDYLDKEDVRIFSTDAILRAAKRQKDIKLSSLPVAPLYIDGSFRGCVLKRHKFCSEIHTILPLLTDKKKIKVLRMVLDRVNELVKHNIYPTDLANRKGGLEDNGLSHSNILIDMSLTPHIIDLDGNSACYTENFNQYYYNVVYANVATLIVETLLNIDTSSEFTELDLLYFRKELVSRGLSPETAEKLIDGSYLEEKDVTSLLDQASSGQLILRP